MSIPNTPANWGNESEVDTYIEALIAVGLGVVGLVHPGFKEPTWVQGAVTLAATSSAAIVVFLRSLRKTAIAKIRENKRA